MKQKAKDKILETATRLFHSQGYNATGINQIIEEAEVAKSTLYQYYKSKEELAVDYLETRHKHWFEALQTFIAKGKTSKDRLLLCFDFIAYMNQKEQYRGCCFLNMLSEIQPEDTTIRKVLINHKTNLQDFFETLAADNVSENFKLLYILFEGALIESKLYRDDWPVDAAKKAVIYLIT
jgi:AcrR family transcriptional regulator